ncbi:hypothetical protein [Actinopolyspora saharensis]|uniref:hypothetical protein n=1 Tax=Actinopolyspora saharensis TaxID=995062 RepID=UPI003F666BA7
MRLGYTLEEAPAPGVSPGRDVRVASRELDAHGDWERLREGLHAWAVEELTRRRCEFGLYIAEFGTWLAEGDPGYYLRESYFVWSGDEVFTTHVEDSGINVEGVRVLTAQADSYHDLRRREAHAS